MNAVKIVRCCSMRRGSRPVFRSAIHETPDIKVFTDTPTMPVMPIQR